MTRFLHKLKTARNFSLEQWKVILQAYGLFLKIRWLLVSRPAPTVAKSFSRPPADSSTVSLSHDFKKTLRQSFRVAWRYQLGKPKCLATALAWQALLSFCGETPHLRIGVQKEGNRLRAHAWCEGKIVFNQEPGYQPLQPLRVPGR